MRTIASIIAIVALTSVWPAAAMAQASEPVIIDTTEAPAATASSNRRAAAQATIYGRYRQAASDAAANLLILPAKEATTEELAELTEDITVMSRILDKKLHDTRLGAALRTSRDVSFIDNLIHTQDRRGTESLYLDGYGLLFFTSVGFPLVAPAEPADEEADEPAQEVDTVWEEAKDELTRPPGQGKHSPVEERYDPKTVTRLEETILSSLRHATHIRNLKDDSYVTVVVTERRTRGHGASTAGVITYYSTGNLQVDRAPEAPLRRPAGTLVIRASKADVDALAAGEFDLDAFRSKADIILSHAAAGEGTGSGWPPPAGYEVRKNLTITTRGR
jgi:hypothetical protein